MNADLLINGVLPGRGACVVDGCARTARRGDLMCRPHWSGVPGPLRADVMATSRAWWRGDVDLGELRDVQLAAVASLSVGSAGTGDTTP